jgi:predicted glutamine amidotransferase
MCVIIHKPFGADIPSREVLQAAWELNPDGAGIAFRTNEKSLFTAKKGLMTFDAFLGAFYSIPDCCEIVAHFRIGTSGGYTAQKTHPFPLSKDAEALDNSFLSYEKISKALFHNGIVGAGAGGLSDTQVLCKELCVKSDNAILTALEREAHSRFLYIHEKNVSRVGTWRKFDGCYYSNEYPLYDFLYFSEKKFS